MNRRLSTQDQAFFAKRLSFLIGAGVPLLDGLHMIREGSGNKRYNAMLDQLIKGVSNGQSLSKSMENLKNVFGDFAINIIAVGEATGTLSENLSYLSEELKKKQILRKKVVGALVYPAFITVATLGVTALLTVYIFPKILPIFASLNVDLPFTTRIVMFLSDFLRHWGFVLMVVVIAGVIALRILHDRNKKFRFQFDRTVLRVPLFGKMIQNYNLANISRNLSLLLQGGMVLSDALPVTARATNNLVYRREFEKLAAVVERGEKISSHLRKYKKLFPDILAQIVAVGEKSGRLSDTLVYLSELYESEVEESTKNLSSLIEPVLMVFMGLVVGFLAISVITPIYGITQHLSPK